MGLWVSLFFLIPITIVLFYSIMTKPLRGGVDFPLTFDAFLAIANPEILKMTLTTLWIALISTAITILIALPCAYYMARKPNNTLLLLLIIIPFWVNFMIRVHAWMTILGRQGMLNDLLQWTGLIGEPIQFLFNQGAVIIVLVYTYLPFAILPLYSTIEKFDFGLLEAGRDLGATHQQSLWKILLPNIQSGIFTAVLFTFIPTFGAYAIPDLVGGPDSYMLGNKIANELLKTRNWPLAASISVLITAVTSVLLLIYFLYNRSQEKSKVNLQEKT